MNVLILHHFSDYWSSGLEKYGTTFEEEMEKVLDYLEHEDIDKVILPLFEQHELEDCHYPLAEFCQSNGIELEVHEYNYAWSKESDPHGEVYTEENFGITWCYGTREGHDENDVVEIEQWQWDLVGNKVYIAGSFANECVLDLTTALDAINTTIREKSLTEKTTHNVSDLIAALDAIEVDYEEEEGLIVGTFAEYLFRGQTREEIINEITEKLQEIENEVESKIDFINEEYDEVISDLEELHIFDPDFMKSIEDKINEVFEEYEEVLENKNIREGLLSGYIEEIVDNVFIEHVESSEYQDQPEEHVEKMVEMKIRKFEHSYDDFTDMNSIQDFILEDERTAEDYFTELDNIYDELVEKYGKEEVEEVDIVTLSTNTITDDYWNEYLIKNELLNIEAISFLANKELEKKLEGTFYHGSKWLVNKETEVEESAFLSLDQDYGSLGAVYISQEENVADWFVNYNKKDEVGIPVVFKFENVEVNKIFNLNEDRIKEEYLNKKIFKYEGVPYDVNRDREYYFRELEKEYNGVIVENNYPELNGGDDIALFDEGLINDNLTEIKLFINNKWTDYMKPEEAVELYEKERKNMLEITPKKRKRRTM